MHAREAGGALVWLSTGIPVVLLLVAPIWMYIASTDELVRVVLKQGWLPVITAMAISRYDYALISLKRLLVAGDSF